jgi:hypothetical protein
MINAVIAQILKCWAPRLRVALVLVFALVIGGLPSHIASSHAKSRDHQFVAINSGDGHTHEEPGGAITHSDLDHDPDAADHSHQVSLPTNHQELDGPDLIESWHERRQDSFWGSRSYDIEKPPKLAASL